MPLSAIQVKELKPAVKDRKIFDGGGLYLHLKKDGKKYLKKLEMLDTHFLSH